MDKPGGLILDLSGVLYQGDMAIEGAIETINALQRRNYPLGFLTNSCRESQQAICEKLLEMGFNIKTPQVITGIQAAAGYIRANRIRPYLVVHPNALEAFRHIPQDCPNAVLVADPAETLSYHNLNNAFRLLKQGAPLLCVAQNKYFLENDQLSLDVGAIVHALAFAADVTPKVLGKPAREFFHAAVATLNMLPARVMMVGDDVQSDVLGAHAAGLQACLVRTGKFSTDDEKLLKGENLRCEDSLHSLVTQMGLL